jgi:hypothetical protein
MRIEIAYGQKEWITIASAVDEPQAPSVWRILTELQAIRKA